MNPNIELFLRNLISLNYFKSSIYSYYVSDLNEVYDTDGKKKSRGHKKAREKWGHNVQL